MQSAQYDNFLKFSPSIKVPNSPIRKPVIRINGYHHHEPAGCDQLRVHIPGSSAEVLASSLSNKSSFISQAAQVKQKISPIAATGSSNTTMEDPKQLHKRELLTLVLLQHLCTQMDPSPATFAKACAQLVEKGYLSESCLGNEETLKLRCKEFVLEAERDVCVIFCVFHNRKKT